jgi:hypothetical protein
VLPEVKERSSANKQGKQNFNIERFNLKELNEVEGKDQYQVKM